MFASQTAGKERLLTHVTRVDKAQPAAPVLTYVTAQGGDSRVCELDNTALSALRDGCKMAAYT